MMGFFPAWLEIINFYKQQHKRLTCKFLCFDAFSPIAIIFTHESINNLCIIMKCQKHVYCSMLLKWKTSPHFIYATRTIGKRCLGSFPKNFSPPTPIHISDTTHVHTSYLFHYIILYEYNDDARGGFVLQSLTIMC